MDLMSSLIKHDSLSSGYIGIVQDQVMGLLPQGTNVLGHLEHVVDVCSFAPRALV